MVWGGGELVDEGSPYTAEAHEWCGGQAGRCRGVIVTWVESASVQDSTLSFSRFCVQLCATQRATISVLAHVLLDVICISAGPD